MCLRSGHITRDCTIKALARQRTADVCTPLCSMQPIGLACKSRDTEEESSCHQTQWRSPNQTNPSTGNVYHIHRREDPTSSTHLSQSKRIVLHLIPVRVYSPESKRSQLIYALLDSRSDVTLCHERLLKDLHIQGQTETMSLTTLNKTHCSAPT